MQLGLVLGSLATAAGEREHGRGHGSRKRVLTREESRRLRGENRRTEAYLANLTLNLKAAWLTLLSPGAPALRPWRIKATQ
ncbi:uncharacterized protein VTP21DRAFT_3559 [Calcarisporiella thermophila]|uniref:uncharacterized protein n=1 Tax=Calcarisporiella thermophila TaxID=911321 RepID=UPI003743C07A